MVLYLDSIRQRRFEKLKLMLTASSRLASCSVRSCLSFFQLRLLRPETRAPDGCDLALDHGEEDGLCI